MRQGIDFSWARPGGVAIRAAGFEFVIRYVPYLGHGGKGITPEEIADYRANGLAIALVFESTAGRALDGFAAGAADAQQCESSVTDLGFPATLPIYFAVDFDAQPGQLPAIDEYLAGATSVLGPGRVGVYGSYRVIEHCHAVGSASWFWQALAWSGGLHSDWRHIYQSLNGQMINGGAVDYDEAADEFGQWKAEVDDMTEDQVKAIIETFMGAAFPNYLKAAFEPSVPGGPNGFSDRPDLGMTFPYRPWALEENRTSIPEVSRDG